MSELIAAGVVGLVLGIVIGGSMGFDKGWRAGVAWAHARVFGG